MIREEEKDQASGVSWKTYSRSMSWTERPPRKTTSKPQWNSKARACLPPLQPLSISRPSIEEWPRAGSDDLGIWPNPPTPGARAGSVTPRENSSSDQPPREFEFRKDKLAFFNKECSRILDHIYLGSDAIAKDREILRQNGITHVLNCVGFVCPEYFKDELVYKTLWLQDCPSEDITSILYDVFDYFEDVREQAGRVLVHCCQGVSRSTSLVIAYLMWKEGQSFDDAFQHVKAARGVTNPNVGFACQLLQCQKRVHALPASPTSLLRMYRMAPHSPYDPLHLVPKMLCEPGADRLDSRGAFIIHIPSALYVWTGKHCSPVMLDNARAAGSQVIRYERAQGPVITVKEGEETLEFWDALSYGKSSADGCKIKLEEEESPSAGSNRAPAMTHPCLGERKLAEYDIDFEIFHGALAGGVVPPFPVSEAGSETCLPAREHGWNTLRRKFANGVVKEFITSSKLNSGALQIRDEVETIDTCKEVEEFVLPADDSVLSSDQCDSPDSFAASSPGWTKNNLKEVGYPAPLSDTSLPQSPSFSLVDSFSSFLVNKPKSNSTSPSLSPSTSDYSSSFTFSPSSSNWSDLSFVSAQPSPYGLESSDVDSGKSGLVEESVGSAEESTYLLDNSTSPPAEEASSPNLASRGSAGSCSTCGKTSPSRSEHRGSSIPLRMSLPSIDEASQISEKLTRYLEDDVTRDAESKSLSCEASFEMNGGEPISVLNSYVTDDEVLSRLHVGKKNDAFCLAADDMTNKITESANLVFYQWPSMHKLNMGCGILDSSSVYIILMPAISFGTKVADVLYIWIGRNVSSKGSFSQLIRKDSKYEDSDAHVETIFRNVLTEKGFSADAQIKIVKEGEEPVHLLKHLARFSSKKDLNDRNK
ncbi:Dual specificity phosphatase [Handroanthus impetiginosus]|uniref:Dual specificity phosphatase n=1 Tax=Handroanthus impetiginosus TaxID=429701 RepID=A0A2G9HZL2_9LAMI|nr:Dual specificity phosphatase [Handroanthus impetiginosus]